MKKFLHHRKGHFVKVFLSRGTYYYSTGFVDDQFTTHLSGKITVTKAKERADEIEILVTDSFSDRQWGEVNEIWEHTADHVGTIGESNGVSQTECTYQRFNLETALTILPTDAHYIIYSFKYTAIIESITITGKNTPFMTVDLTVDGISSSGNCQNANQLSAAQKLGTEIVPKFTFSKSNGRPKLNGDYQLDHADSMSVLESYRFNLNLAGLGNAYFNDFYDELNFRIKPIIQSISPTLMSTFGNTEIKFSGAGFMVGDKPTLVYIKPLDETFEYPVTRCTGSVVAYDSVTCTIPRIYGAVTDLTSVSYEVLLDFDGTQLNDTDWPTIFTDQSMTTKISAASPNTISLSTSTITFSVENFSACEGDSVCFEIYLGDNLLENCLLDGSKTSVACDSPNLAAGEYAVSGQSTKGEIDVNTGKVSFVQSATGILTNTGGRFGGQMVEITGFGFSQGRYTIVIDNFFRRFNFPFI